MAAEFHAYFIHCITNMHAGSGDASYGIIDKLVQRDPVTDCPCIHASSLKGALREHFETKLGKPNLLISTVFGKEGKETQTGAFKFLGADMAALPVRCNYQQYVMAINKRQAQHINHKCTILTKKEIFDTSAIPDTNTFSHIANAPIHDYDVYAEDWKLEKRIRTNILRTTTDEFFNHGFASFSSEDFATLVKNLPVLARNRIEDGTSDNLWYEQVVPHQSLFVTYIFETGDNKKDFEQILQDDIIQIGGNATVGYGLCKFYKIKFN